MVVTREVGDIPSCAPMPDQKLAVIRRQDRLVKVDDDGSVYIRSGSSMPWRELRAAKRALED